MEATYSEIPAYSAIVPSRKRHSPTLNGKTNSIGFLSLSMVDGNTLVNELLNKEFEYNGTKWIRRTQPTGTPRTQR